SGVAQLVFSRTRVNRVFMRERKSGYDTAALPEVLVSVSNLCNRAAWTFLGDETSRVADAFGSFNPSLMCFMCLRRSSSAPRFVGQVEPIRFTWRACSPRPSVYSSTGSLEWQPPVHGSIARDRRRRLPVRCARSFVPDGEQRLWRTLMRTR